MCVNGSFKEILSASCLLVPKDCLDADRITGKSSIGHWMPYLSRQSKILSSCILAAPDIHIFIYISLGYKQLIDYTFLLLHLGVQVLICLISNGWIYNVGLIKPTVKRNIDTNRKRRLIRRE